MNLVVDLTVDAPDFRRTKATDLAFRDPLVNETRRVRTQLLFVAALAILVKVYDLKIQKTPWLDIDVPVNAPGLLEGALSVALVYLLFVFVLFGWQDFRRWRLAGDIHLVHGSFDLILHSRNDLFAITQHLDKLTADAPLRDEIRAAVEAAARRLPESQAKLQTLRSELARLSWLQWFRLIAVEIGVPLVLGTFALVKTWPAIPPFVQAVLK